MGGAVPTAGLSQDQIVAFVLFDVAIIVALARLIGSLFTRIGQPRVVGEIVAGVLLGPTLLGAKTMTWGDAPDFLHCDSALAGTETAPSISACLFPPQSQSVLAVLGQLGLAFFMLLVGLEVKRGLLKRGRLMISALSFTVVAVPFALGFVVGPILYGQDWVGAFGTPAQPSRIAFSMMVGAMLAVTAFPVMVRILQEKSLTRSHLGAIAIGVGAGTTIFTFLLVATAEGIATGAGSSSVVRTWLLAAAFLLAVVYVARPMLTNFGRRYGAENSLDGTGFAFVITLALVAAFVSHQLGLTVIVGAFLVGLVLPARASLLPALRSRLDDITIVVLLPIFLAFSGLRTDFTTLSIEQIGGLTLLVAAAIVGKWVGGALPARASGMGWQEANILAVLFNCRGFLVLVVAQIALAANVITPQLHVGAVLVALVTTMMTGPALQRFLHDFRPPGESDLRGSAPHVAAQDEGAMGPADTAPHRRSERPPER